MILILAITIWVKRNILKILFININKILKPKIDWKVNHM